MAELTFDTESGQFVIQTKDGTSPINPRDMDVKQIEALQALSLSPKDEATERKRSELIAEIYRNVEATVRRDLFEERMRAEMSEAFARVTGDSGGQIVMNLLMTGMFKSIEEMTAGAKDNLLSSYREEIARLEERLRVARPPIVIEHGIEREIEGLTHQAFPELMSSMSTGIPTMMVGPAGSGKTTAAKQVADALGLSFHSISVGMQTSKVDFLGYMSGHGVYVPTEFRRAYEEGGVFLTDEIDAGNPNVLIVLNSAITQPYAPFPDGMVPKHPNFLFVATANTYGMGASRQYVGRNQIDAATLDRFITVDWPIDEAMEKAIVSWSEHHERWHKVVLACRRAAEENDYRIVISPRATIKGVELLERGLDFERILNMVLVPTAGADQREVLIDVARKAWR